MIALPSMSRIVPPVASRLPFDDLAAVDDGPLAGHVVGFPARDVEQRDRFRDAGDVEHGVKTADGLDHMRDGAPYLVAPRDVEFDRDRRAAGIVDARGYRSGPFVIDIAQTDLGPLLGNAHRHSGAHALDRAGDRQMFAGQSFAVHLALAT
jgi:hypothetical protein